MGQKRRKKKWVDPEVLARGAEKRARDRRERRRLRVMIGLLCVGVWALCMLLVALWPSGQRDRYRYGWSREEPKNELFGIVVVEMPVMAMRAVGMTEGWIVLGGVVVGCAAGVGYLIWRLGRKEGGARGAAERVRGEEESSG